MVIMFGYPYFSHMDLGWKEHCDHHMFLHAGLGLAPVVAGVTLSDGRDPEFLAGHFPGRATVRVVPGHRPTVGRVAGQHQLLALGDVELIGFSPYIDLVGH